MRSAAEVEALKRELVGYETHGPEDRAQQVRDEIEAAEEALAAADADDSTVVEVTDDGSDVQPPDATPDADAAPDDEPPAADADDEAPTEKKSRRAKT